MGKTGQPTRPQNGQWKYLVLLAGFWNIAITFGTVTSTGVFVVEWMVYYDIGAAAASSMVIGTSLILPLMSPFAGVMCQRFGCGRVCIFGGCLSSACLVLASFSPNIPYLISMICIFGFGSSFVLIPCYAVIGYYFRGHLALANSIMMAGSSVGILAITPLVQFLCTTYGWKGAYLVLAGVYGNTIVSGVIFQPTQEEKSNIVRRRRDYKEVDLTDISIKDENSVNLTQDQLETENEIDANTYCLTNKTSHDSKSIEEITHLRRCLAATKNTLLLVVAPIFKLLQFLHFNLLLTHPRLGLLCLASLISNCGYFSHIVYLISRVIYDLDFSKEYAAILMVIIGASGIVGGVAQGAIIDNGFMTVNTLTPISLVLTGLSSMANPLANTFAGQVILAVTMGIGSGIFMSLSPMYVRQLLGQQFMASANGLRILSLGLGNTIGSISMGALYDAVGSFSVVFYVAGGFSFLAASITCAMACYTVKKFAPLTD